MRSLLETAVGKVLVVFAAAWGMASGADAQSARKEPPPSRAAAQYSFAPIVKRAAPAVVNVHVRGRVQTQLSPFADDPLLRRFFGERFGMPVERMQSSLGSGVIVSPDGLVVTNTHVVKLGSTSEIRVVLVDRREFDAKVILQDEKSDIAILRLEGNNERFPYLQIEDSDAIEVGDLVLAIGNPFGVGQTVTSGIVSALSRSEIGKSQFQAFIQTDAAINPGNSGGALVDMAGGLVGINTAIYSRSGGSHGIGFAIPSNLVRLYVESAQTGRKVQYPWLGARLESVTRDIADGLGLTRAIGALVTRVHAKSPAAAGGLLPGDVVISADGHDITDARSLNYRLTTRGIGNTTRLEVLRKGNKATVEVALTAPPSLGRDDVRNLSGGHPLDGLRVANLLPHVADELNLDEQGGVVVLSVRPDSVAGRLGFKTGDLILSVGDTQIGTVLELERAMRTRPRLWQIWVKRGGRGLQLQLPG